MKIYIVIQNITHEFEIEDNVDMFTFNHDENKVLVRERCRIKPEGLPRITAVYDKIKIK